LNSTHTQIGGRRAFSQTAPVTQRHTAVGITSGSGQDSVADFAEEGKGGFVRVM
jgi:hypothetical protein